MGVRKVGVIRPLKRDKKRGFAGKTLLPLSRPCYSHSRGTPTYLHPPLRGWEYMGAARGVGTARKGIPTALTAPKARIDRAVLSTARPLAAARCLTKRRKETKRCSSQNYAPGGMSGARRKKRSPGAPASAWGAYQRSSAGQGAPPPPPANSPPRWISPSRSLSSRHRSGHSQRHNRVAGLAGRGRVRTNLR